MKRQKLTDAQKRRRRELQNYLRQIQNISLRLLGRSKGVGKRLRVLRDLLLLEAMLNRQGVRVLSAKRRTAKDHHYPIEIPVGNDILCLDYIESPAKKYNYGVDND